MDGMDWSLVLQASTSELIVVAVLAVGAIYLAVDFAIFAVNQIVAMFDSRERE